MSNPKPLKSKTILQVIPSLGGGGSERSVVDMVKAIVEGGGRALVACEGGRLQNEVVRLGGEVVNLPLASKSPWRIWRNSFALANLAKAEKVNLIHAHSRAPAWSAYLAAKRLGLPFVTTYHSLYNQKSRLKARYNSIMARGDVVIANSHFTRAAVLSRHPVPPKNVVVVYQGTGFDRFDPDADMGERLSALRAQWDLPEGGFVALLPGRMTRIKGQAVFIEACALVKKTLREKGFHTPMTFVMVGDYQGREDYVESLRDQAKGLNVAEDIRLVDHCSDMPAAYALAGIVVSASTQAEAFGRVAVEAQAMRKPVVVTNIGATAETVLAPPAYDEVARTGWHVPPGDAAALAEAIGHIIALPPEEVSLVAARARAHVLKNFSHEAMARASLALYAVLLGDETSKNPL